MEEVLSELEGNPATNSVDKEAAAHTYLEATQKVMDCISNKQDEILKNVKFLKEAILRKHKHEEQLKTMAMCTSRMDLMSTNKWGSVWCSWIRNDGGSHAQSLLVLQSPG